MKKKEEKQGVMSDAEMEVNKDAIMQMLDEDTAAGYSPETAAYNAKLDQAAKTPWVKPATRTVVTFNLPWLQDGYKPPKKKKHEKEG